MRTVGIVTENKVDIQCQSQEQAEKAIRIAKEVLENIPEDLGFGWRTKEIAELLIADEGSVTLSQDCEALPLLDFIDVMKDIIKAVAKELKGSSFSFEFMGSDSTFPEGYLEGSFDGNELSLETSVFGDGLGCPFCGELVIYDFEYDENEPCVCPSCGKEVDLSDPLENEMYIHTKETIQVK